MLKKIRFRFRLRTLLVLFVVVAVFCWWKNEPRRLAREFANYINAGQLEKAQAMITGPPLDKNMEMYLKELLPGRARLSEYSLHDWWAGKAFVAIDHNVVYTKHFVVSGRGIRASDFEFDTSRIDELYR